LQHIGVSAVKESESRILLLILLIFVSRYVRALFVPLAHWSHLDHGRSACKPQITADHSGSLCSCLKKTADFFSRSQITVY